MKKCKRVGTFDAEACYSQDNDQRCQKGSCTRELCPWLRWAGINNVEPEEHGDETED